MLDGIQAIHAYYNGDAYNAYELYLAAGMYNLAHDLAVSELAPDAILRRDLELLALLFEPLANKAVNEWNVQGKVGLTMQPPHCIGLTNKCCLNLLGIPGLRPHPHSPS